MLNQIKLYAKRRQKKKGRRSADIFPRTKERAALIFHNRPFFFGEQKQRRLSRYKKRGGIEKVPLCHFVLFGCVIDQEKLVH